MVNTVNTDGVTGKGIALQFKNEYPGNYKEYRKACKYGDIGIGKLFVYEEESLLGGKKLIINFPTKTTWRKPSEYSYIEAGLKDLIEIIKEILDLLPSLLWELVMVDLTGILLKTCF